MIAFQRFNEINRLPDVIDKHRAWLLDYEGKKYSKALNGIDLIKWKNTKYSNKNFEADINKVGELGNRLRIEFDGDEVKAKGYLEQTYNKLKEMKWGFIRSSHKGKSDYLWIEFTRNLTPKEKKNFLMWIAPKGSEVDLNFSSPNFCFPVMFAVHWKHSDNREKPLEYFEGEQIDYDSLNIKEPQGKPKRFLKQGIDYQTFEKEEVKEVSEEEFLTLFRESYDKIIEVLKDYLDLNEKYYNLIALWILGSHIHKQFNSYPYLFINAMRGSGKTRLLKLIKYLSRKGELIMSLTEAVLFRSSNDSTMCIDEFESIGSKEKSTLRELLNASYKKGVVVKRIKKIKTMEGEEQVPEEFELYRPIALANIWGMEEVLGDRCISIFLEKSNNPLKTLLIEDFDNDNRITEIVKAFSVCLCSVCSSKNVYRDWNQYIREKFSVSKLDTTFIHTHSQTTPIYINIHYEKMFNKIIGTNIDGRNLELFFPIFQIADMIGEEVLDTTIKLANEIVTERKSNEVSESRDVMLFDFVSQLDSLDFHSVKELTTRFRVFIEADDNEEKEDKINPKWFGLALKRLCLITNKRRLGHGMEVMLDIYKAKNKIKMFK